MSHDCDSALQPGQLGTGGKPVGCISVFPVCRITGSIIQTVGLFICVYIRSNLPFFPKQNLRQMPGKAESFWLELGVRSPFPFGFFISSPENP